MVQVRVDAPWDLMDRHPSRPGKMVLDLDDERSPLEMIWLLLEELRSIGYRVNDERDRLEG